MSNKFNTIGLKELNLRTSKIDGLNLIRFRRRTNSNFY